ncbi:MAG TPA: SDR family oxidoreductase [Acidimicrobiales bacterium]|nr:SDR family oxidoreductase [Acidimicrobiales bacterium]
MGGPAGLFDVTGKVVLLTGASYGLGETMARGLAGAGAHLVLAARTAEALESVAKDCRELGSEVTTVVADVSREEDVARIVDAAIGRHGRIDVLVNNAGISDMRGVPAEQFDLETFRRIIDVDLLGAYALARDTGRHMLAAGRGSIINICSIMGSGANELNVIAYTGAKGGLLNLTYQLGCEWADRGVRVNAISPGFIVTPMTAPALDSLGVAEYVASRTPMRRVGRADELLGPLLFLASDASSYVTGLNLLVDGGTNAANGYYQIRPGHHGWGDMLGVPAVGETYPGLAPLPERLHPWAAGVPGIHIPLPATDSGA